MNVTHVDKSLELLETRDVQSLRLSREIVRAYRKRMQFIRDAMDERDFYGLKSLHYEKLAGKRSHERSMRLNDQFRLIVRIGKAKDEKVVVIISIEDYH